MTTLLPTLPLNNLDHYIATVNRIPMLTLAQETQLAQAWRMEQKITAAEQLVLSHLRVVVRIARTYLGYGLAFGDLIQEGNIGLMKAVKRFNVQLGVRLVTFALHWIKAEIHEFIIKNIHIVKVITTKAKRKLFFKLRQTQQALTVDNEPPSTAAIAKALTVSPTVVAQMQQRLNHQDVTLDAIYEIADINADPAKLLEQETSIVSHKAQLQLALKTLDARSRDILNVRWLNENTKMTLRALADKYHVSIERIRQLEKAAIDKLRLAMIETA